MKDLAGPIIVAAVKGPLPGLPADGQVFVACKSIAAARSILADPASAGVAVVPLSFHEFLRALPLCPTVVWLETDGENQMTAIAAIAELGAVGTLLVGPRECPAGFRRLEDGTLELTRVNGRRPMALSDGVFRECVSLLGAALSDISATDADVFRAVDAVLGQAAREVVHLQGNVRAWPFGGECAPLPSVMSDGRPWPRVSVVTPAFRQGRYLEENILSVLRQNYPNLEHIVCDGGSDDETVPVLRRYDAHLSSWVSEKDKGQSDALNKGFRKATGEIITWLNSDDMFAPGALAAAVIALMATGADMVAGIAEIHQNGVVVSRHLTSCGDGLLPLEDLLNLDDCWLRGQFFYQPEVLFTRDLWDRAGGYVREDLHYSMDYEMWLRMAKAGARLTVIGAPIALFRKHEEQKTFLTTNYEPELRELRDTFAKEVGVVVPPPSTIEETRRLKIVCFNDNGFRFGAGIGHRRLVEALQLGGHQITCLCAKDLLRGADVASPAQLADTLLKGNPDIVFLGNLHGAGLGAEFITVLSQRSPVIFFMHDYWLITGRCAYMEGCKKYLKGCDRDCTCATDYPPLAPERVADAWERKRLLHFGESPVHVATNSRAVADVVDEYFVLQDAPGRTVVVNLPLPLDVLQPMDRATCRRLLGIPQDTFLVLFSAGRLDEPRKGVDLLLEAIGLSGIPNLHLGCLGREEGAAQFPRKNLHFFGYVGDPTELARIYSAADVYVGPSRDETFGQVFTEAAACGTPSIGFAVGGVPEAVINGWTGLVAPEISAEKLAAALVEIWSRHGRGDIFSAVAPALVRGRFAREKTLNQLHGLLTEVLAKRGKRLARKLPLPITKPDTPTVTRIQQALVRHISGFDRFEPANKAGRATKCCWVFGPKAELDLTVERGGRYHLILQYTCPLRKQVLSIRTETRFLGEFALDFSPGELCTLAVPFYGSVGTQRLTFYPSHRVHHQAAGPERAAFRLYGMALVPRAK